VGITFNLLYFVIEAVLVLELQLIWK